MVEPSDAAPSPATDPWDDFLPGIERGISEGLNALGVPLAPAGVAEQLELDGSDEGDVAFPVFRFAGPARLPPPEFAARLAAAIPPDPAVLAVRAKGGYVNVRVDPTALAGRTLALVAARGPRYGHADGQATPACVEHTSANTTGPFHIGRVRNAIIGDTLARILAAAGQPVTTQYYVDDMGRQAAMITWIWSQSRDAWPAAVRAAVDGHERDGEKPDLHWGRPYPAVSALVKDDEGVRGQVAEVVRAIETGAAPPRHHELVQAILDGMLASLARLGIRFDEFVWESGFVRDGSVDRVLARLAQAPHAVRESNGALAIDASSYRLPKESSHVVVQRGDGTSLYVTRDVAYHLAKFARFRRAVDVLGQDHQLHARTLDALLAEVGESRRPEFLIYQDITVPEGGRMSTRGGSAVWLDQLLDEAVERARAEVVARRDDLDPAAIDRIAEAVATGAVRYHVLRVAPEKPVVFRWDDALSFEGRSGPFVQYAYARAASVLRKAERPDGPIPFDARLLVDPDELGLVRVLARFPRVVRAAARTNHVHAVAGYAHDVADRFNRFYHAVPVLKSGAERSTRLALVAAVRQTLGNALDLIGVPRLETM